MALTVEDKFPIYWFTTRGYNINMLLLKEGTETNSYFTC